MPLYDGVRCDSCSTDRGSNGDYERSWFIVRREQEGGAITIYPFDLARAKDYAKDQTDHSISCNKCIPQLIARMISPAVEVHQ